MTTNLWLIGTNLPGRLTDGDGHESFEASPHDAVLALLDECDFQLECDPEDEDEAHASDRAYIESLRGHEGMGDLLMLLEHEGTLAVHLESLFNSFGGYVTLLPDED